jgi:hypothetical protein
MRDCVINLMMLQKPIDTYMATIGSLQNLLPQSISVDVKCKTIARTDSGSRSSKYRVRDIPRGLLQCSSRACWSVPEMKSISEIDRFEYKGSVISQSVT